ncbi:fibrinogen C domain-containing protein 1-like isoform X2 [Macrobrachium nipponense]|uniref:fibrinogen C domain-containing protein 1-like isoform X2 n=1 Tax=Macrobrachium nipponense TaxID=159736 RepID=UPI0030C7ABB8
MIPFHRDMGRFRRILLLTMTMIEFFAPSKASQHWSECFVGDEDPALMARLMFAELEFDEISKDLHNLTTLCNLPEAEREQVLQECKENNTILEKRLNETKEDMTFMTSIKEKEKLQNLTNLVNILRKEIGENFTSMGNSRPMDCADVRILGNTTSGEYTIFPTEEMEARVLCDMDTELGGWTVFLKFHDASIGQIEHFLTTDGTREGDSLYWLGEDVLHYLTQYNFTVRGEMDINGKDTSFELATYFRFLESTRLSDSNQVWQALLPRIKVYRSDKVSLTMQLRRRNYGRISQMDDQVPGTSGCDTQKSTKKRKVAAEGKKILLELACKHLEKDEGVDPLGQSWAEEFKKL